MECFMNQKVCVVTGIGPGLGSAYARRFAAGGYRVALLGRTHEKLASYAAEINGSLPVVCDGVPELVGVKVWQPRFRSASPHHL